MSDFLSRARGALMGLVVGDAVGTTNEFQPAGSFEPITDMVGGGVFGLEPGQWTDDTSMALCLAVHGLLDFPSFKDATLAIANMGGDSDTNAAIYGQLGGAFYGIEGIPASWRSTLYQGEEIDELARDLVELRLEPPVTRFDEDLQGEAPSA